MNAPDLEKLNRLEDRAASASAALRATFDRYRERLNSADRKRRQALSSPVAFQYLAPLTWAELATVAPEDLQRAQVDRELLASAFGDRKAAAELHAEHERMAAAIQAQNGLLHRLRQYAGRE